MLSCGIQYFDDRSPSYVTPAYEDPERRLVAEDLDDRQGLWRRPQHMAERNAFVDLALEAGWRSLV
jgi:hypothetical protein